MDKLWSQNLRPSPHKPEQF